MRIINLDLVKNPVNWIIIILMLIIAGAFGHLFLTYLGVEPKTNDSTISNGLVQPA